LYVVAPFHQDWPLGFPIPDGVGDKREALEWSGLAACPSFVLLNSL
jgi:hypothetical protein